MWMFSFLSNLARKGSKLSVFISFTEALEIEVMCANVFIIVSRLASTLSENGAGGKSKLIFRYEAEGAWFPQVL